MKLLMYGQLHSYMMIFTTVLFIVYIICMYLRFYSEQYFYVPSKFYYICTRVTQMLGFFPYTHGCTHPILTSDKN